MFLDNHTSTNCKQFLSRFLLKKPNKIPKTEPKKQAFQLKKNLQIKTNKREQPTQKRKYFTLSKGNQNSKNRRVLLNGRQCSLKAGKYMDSASLKLLVDD